jgi:hypothetical protein
MSNLQSKLKDPIHDLRFLLDRGYNKDSAIRVVADKYRLTKKQRNFLLRAIFSKKEAREHKKKLTKSVRGKDLVVDGYNVLITVESFLKKRELFLSDDGFVRDISATFGKYRITRATPKAIDLILKKLNTYNSKSVTFIFDSQVSFSGELCRMFREKMSELDIKGDARTSENADFTIANTKGIICTSDRAIIKKAKKVLDLAGKVTGLGP